MELGAPYNAMELASFMSGSKGYMGECGIRGGYVELINLCPDVKAVFMKAISAGLCPTALGQAVMDCVVRSLPTLLTTNYPFRQIFIYLH